MATYFARKSGNVNATDVWATTPSGTASDVFSSFTNADVLMANSFTVTLNVNTTVKEVRNDTTGSATAGGSFSLSNGITLTADVYAGTASCVTLASTASGTIVGNITGGSAANASGVNMTSSGTLTVTGAVTGGTNVNTSYGIVTSSSAMTLNITGNITASTTTRAVACSGGTITVVGNVQGGGSSNAWGIQQVTTPCTLTVTGTVTGGTSSASEGIWANGNVTVSGTCVGGAGAPGLVNAGTGTITVVRAKGGPAASSSAGVNGSTIGSVSVEEVEWGDVGASPTQGCIRLTDKASNVAVMYRFGTTKKNLVDANASGLMPSASNVRYGTVYNGGNSTGTCYVPAASSVAYGVNVDNTTGTAVITSAAVQSACDAALTAFSSGRLSNVATVASVGQALSDALTQ